MCTFSYAISNSQEIIFTSNRDERFLRSRALLPNIYDFENIQLIYPIDPDGGGTWLAASKSRVICLLNGAFFPHQPRPPYRKSRGKIVLESFNYENPATFLTQYSLDNIEPFTLIWADLNQNVIWEINWQQKVFLSRHELTSSKLWASAMLYPAPIRKARSDNFHRFLQEQPISPESLLNFHTQWDEDPKKSIQIHIPELLSTVSVSSIVVTSSQISFLYQDLLTRESNLNVLNR